MPPPGWEVLQPQGLSLAILVVTIIFSALSIIVITLRVSLRLRYKVFVVEDALMCIGFIINMVHNGCVCYGAYTGLGTPDSKIPGGKTGPIYKEGLKAVFLWQTFYLSGFTFIKCSICLAILRIAILPLHRKILWALIWLSVGSTTIVAIFIPLQCRPIEGIWKEKEAVCFPKAAYVSVTFIISGLNLATDFATAILPTLMIKDLQMPRRKKKALMIILGVGIFASVATLARLPFAKSYFDNTDYLVGLGHIIFWTVVECSLALIAGCLPTLHRLVKNLSPSASSGRYIPGHSEELVTIGRRRGYVRQNEISATREGPFIDERSESAQGITVQRELIVIHEHRSTDKRDDSDSHRSHHAQTYV